jgi:hypothetical protein
VIIPTAYKVVYDKILEENATYSLSNFQVVSNELVFKASKNKFLSKWTGGTTADDINVHDVPKSDIKFKPFAEIILGKWRPDVLVSEFNTAYNIYTLLFYIDIFLSNNHLMLVFKMLLELFRTWAIVS